MTDPVTPPQSYLVAEISALKGVSPWVINEVKLLEAMLETAWDSKIAKVAMVVCFCLGFTVGCVV